MRPTAVMTFAILVNRPAEKRKLLALYSYC